VGLGDEEEDDDGQEDGDGHEEGDDVPKDGGNAVDGCSRVSRISAFGPSPLGSANLGDCEQQADHACGIDLADVYVLAQLVQNFLL
jgi:hypothetical protein